MSYNIYNYEELIEQIKKLNDEGKSHIEIKDILNISKNKVNIICREHKIKRKQIFNYEKYRDILYDLFFVKVLSIDEIAEQLNITKSMVMKYLKQNGFKRNKSIIFDKQREKYKLIEYPKINKQDDTEYCVLLESFNIDISKISRNYEKYPLKPLERFNKEDLIHLYYDLDLLIPDICNVLNCSESILHSNLSEYKIKRDMNKQRERTNQTNIIKYGGVSPSHSQEILEKQKKTMIERYGVDNYSKTDEFKVKYKEVMNKNYGVDNFFQKYKRCGRDSVNYNHLTDEQYNILKTPELLKEVVNKNKHMYDVAKIIGVAPETVYRYLKDYGISYNFEIDVSSYELELRKYIKDECIYNKKHFDKEIDIFIPSKNIGIEFNGDYWHGEMNKTPNWHFEKSKHFENNGIFIYHIFEWEWNTKKDKILNQLNNILGYNTEKIYARKCIIKEVPTKEKSEFLEQHHLQGKDRSKVNYGLYYNNELVSVMTFIQPKFNKHYQWELSRFCSKSGYNIIGGASKLFNHFVKIYKPESVISYSDIAHTRGKLYETLGFDFDTYVRPNYIWKVHRHIVLKSSCRKKYLNKLDESNVNKSESEIMHEKGGYKIYNCGLKRWIWKQ